MAVGSFEAGKVHIRVLPDASEFNRKLMPQLRRSREEAERLMHIEVTPVLDKSGVARMRAQLQALGRGVRVKVGVDQQGFSKSLQETSQRMSREMSQQQYIHVKPVAEWDGIKREARDIFKSAEPVIEPKLDKTLFQRQHKELIESLRKTPNVPAVELGGLISSDRFREASHAFRDFADEVEEDSERSGSRLSRLADRIQAAMDKISRAFHAVADVDYSHLDGDDVTDEFFDNIEQRQDELRGRPLRLDELIIRGDSDDISDIFKEMGESADEARERLRNLADQQERANKNMIKSFKEAREAGEHLSFDDMARSFARGRNELERTRRELKQLEDVQRVFQRRAKEMMNVDFSRPFSGFKSSAPTVAQLNKNLERSIERMKQLADASRQMGDNRGVLRAQMEQKRLGREIEENNKRLKLFDRSMSDVFTRKRNGNPFSEFSQKGQDGLKELENSMKRLKQQREELRRAYREGLASGDAESLRRTSETLKQTSARLREMRGEMEQIRKNRDLFTNDAAMKKFRDAFDTSKLRNDTFFRDKRSIVVNVDLDSEVAERRLKDLAEDREVTFQADADTKRARFKLARLARPRFALIIPKLDKAAAAKVATALAAISGARATWDFTKKFTDFLKDLDKNLVGLIRLGAIIGTVSAAVLSLTSHVFALGKSLLSIAPAAFALPGIFTGIVVAVFASVNALKQWNDRMKDVNDRLKALNSKAADEFWAKFEAPVRKAIDTLFPAWEKGLLEISQATGEFFANAAKAAEAYGADGFKSIFDALTQGMKEMSNGIGPLMEGFLRFIDIGAQFFPRFGQWFTDMANRFNEWTKTADITGAIDRGIQALKDFWRAGVAFVGILDAIAKAAEQAGGAGLTQFADALERVRNGLNTFEAQTTMITLFSGANEAIKNLAPSFETLGNTLNKTASTISYVMVGITNVINAWVKLVGDALASPMFQDGIRSAIDGITKGMESLSTHSDSLGTILGALGKIIGIMGENFLPVFGTALDALAPMFDDLARAAEAVIPILANWLKDAIQWLGDNLGPVIDKVREWIQQNPEWASGILLVVGAIGAIITALAPAVSALVNFGSALAGLVGGVGEVAAAFGAGGSLEAVGGAIASAAGPVALVVAAILAIAGAIIYVYNTSEEFRNKISELMGKVGEAVQPIVDMFNRDIKPAIDDFVKSFTEGFNQVLEALNPFMTGVVEILTVVFQAMKPLVEWISAIFGPVISGVIGALGGLFQGVFGFIGGLLGGFGNILRSVAAVLRGDFSSAAEFAFKAAQSFANGVASLLQGALQIIGSLIRGIFEAVINFVSLISKNIGDYFRKCFDDANNTLSRFPGMVRDFIGGIPGAIRNLLASVPGIIQNTFHINLGVSGNNMVVDWWNGMVGAFNDVINKIRNKVQQVRNLFPHSPAKTGPFSRAAGYLDDSGKAMMRDWGKGIAMGTHLAVSAASVAAGLVKNEMDVDLTPTISPLARSTAGASLEADLSYSATGSLGDQVARGVAAAFQSGVELEMSPNTSRAVLQLSEGGAQSLRRHWV